MVKLLLLRTLYDIKNIMTKTSKVKRKSIKLMFEHVKDQKQLLICYKLIFK